MINRLDSYAIVDSKGKVVGTFRTKATALEILSYFQKDFYDKLKVITND